MKNVADLYHLTPVQREMLSATGVVQTRGHFDGELSDDVLERAWQQLLARHTILRTCFLSEQLDEPVQIVRQQVKLAFERHDWSDDAPEQQEAKLDELLRADRQRDFDPARAPLFRVTQVRRGARSLEFIISHHPVLLDERSVRLMLDEILAEVHDAEPALPYRAYVGWVERQDLAGAELHWRRSLQSSSITVGPNSNGPRASRQVSFSAAETDALKVFARNQQLSLETLIVSAWSLVLMRERDSREVCIGVRARGLPSGLPEAERMVGLLETVLPLYVAFAGESISSFLQKVERTISRLQQYAHVSQSQIRQWLDLETDSPLFDSLVLFRDLGADCRGGPPWPPVVEFHTRVATEFHTRVATEGHPYKEPSMELEAEISEELCLQLHAKESHIRLIDKLYATLTSLTFPALYLSHAPAPVRVEPSPQPEKPLDFSLFYFADDNAVYGVDKYRLYREGAIFADRHGLTAVWTPERHFHEKAGLYPNPSVLSAALATITKNVKLRAGSVVLPLHNSLRVAEEWSVVDNLSNGRVGVSFTSGWMPNDFAFFPERYPIKRDEMFRGIAEVQSLWRGEPIAGRDGVGKEIELRIFPKPIQPELPMWLTCSGGPEMFEKAGELGCHVLTALLTQSIEEVAPKIKLYRDSLVRHGHNPEDGKVTMMMHTFIGEDAQAVLKKVKIPLTNYLKSHLNLIETGAESLNLQVDLKQTDPEMYRDQLAAFAFERYYRTSSLIGTPASCMKMIERLKEIGVDEVACLIDFGIDVDSVLASLEHLVVLRALSNSSAPETTLLASTAAHV